MALTADPSVTFSSQYNARSNTTLAAGASANFTADFSTSSLGGFVQVWNTGGGTVAGTNGCQVQAFATSDGTHYDTIPFGGVNFTITSVVSTQNGQSFFLPTGKYQITVTNLDVTNDITVGATTAPVA